MTATLDPTLGSIPAGVDANTITAVYTLSIPGDSWDASDDGLYTVSLAGNAIQQLDGTFISAYPSLSTFSVEFPTFLVTNTNDGGAGSLRQAILDANNTASLVNFIGFSDGSNGSVNFTAGSHTITLQSPLPQLSETAGNTADPLTIVGPGLDHLTIDANQTGNVFDLSAADNGTDLHDPRLHAHRRYEQLQRRRHLR